MDRNFADFYGFAENPFKRLPDADFFFSSKSHQEALNALHYMAQSDEGFAVVVGEPGTGKSTTIRKFIQSLPKNVVFAYILFPNLKPEELFYAVLENFGIPLEGSVSKNALFSRLKDFLIATKAEGNSVMIVVDEAQNLPLETFEELRMLSNLETDTEKLLKIALVGQPGLIDKLNSPDLHLLKQRISLYAHLKSLTLDECYNYVGFRMEKAGRKDFFIPRNVTRRVWRQTKGNPRLVNLLMERVIIAAFMDGAHSVKKEHVDSAINSMNIYMEGRAATGRKPKLLVASIFILALVAAGFGYHRFIYTGTTVPVIAANDYVAPAPMPMYTPPAGNEPQNAAPAVITPSDEARPEAAPAVTPPTPPTPPVEPAPLVSPEPAPVFPAPTPEPPVQHIAAAVYTVNTTVLNVRSQPLLDAAKVGILHSGQSVTVIGESDYWLQVNMPEGGTGWVYKRYMVKQDNSTETPN